MIGKLGMSITQNKGVIMMVVTKMMMVTKKMMAMMITHNQNQCNQGKILLFSRFSKLRCIIDISKSLLLMMRTNSNSFAKRTLIM